MKCRNCGHLIIKDKINERFYHKNYAKGEICTQCDKCEAIEKHCFNPNPEEKAREK